MKFLNDLMVLIGLMVIAFVLVGCGISKDEHEKIASELYKTKIEIDKTKTELTKTQKEFANTKTELHKIKAELDKTKMELKQANAEFAEMEKTCNEARSLLKIDLEKQVKEGQAIKFQLIGSRHEVAYLKEELGELLNRFMKTAEELDMTQNANQILRTQMAELIKEKKRLEKLTKN